MAKTNLIIMIRILFSLVLLPQLLFGQSVTQSIRGTVTDKNAKTPLVGAVVQIENLQAGAVCNIDGNFVISGVRPGRYAIVVSILGYKSMMIPNVLLTAGKEMILDIELEEDFTTLKVLSVVDQNKEGTQNRMASVSARTFSIEEVNRYAGGRSDPARLAANFAGVSAPDDSRNDIVVRGNSPVGVLWRMEGIPVNNPNHFASVGTTGGAVSAINTNLLKNSDFFTSAFPAEFGNATAGVFDLGFRSGNNKKKETTIQAGVITGLEVTTEGPFVKNSEASYLIGYRYSLAGVAQAVGVNIGTTATPTYQDLSFKLSSGTRKWGKLSLFGILASSTINIGGGNSSDLYGGGNKVDFGSKIDMGGLTHFKQLNKRSFLTTTIGINYAANDQTAFDFDRMADSSFIKEVSNVVKMVYNWSSNYQLKINTRMTLKLGFQNELMGLSLYYKTKENFFEDEIQVWDYNSSTQLTQSFAQLKWSLTEKFTLNTGVHAQHFFLNQSTSFEPRLGLIYQLNEKNSFNAGYGLHAQMQPINIYFLQNIQADGSVLYTNKNLDFTKSHHFVLGYNVLPFRDWRIKAEAYYQSIYNVPVETSASSYSMLNTGATFKTDLTDSLMNAGTGENYGMELTIEKFFSKGYYLLLTGSRYEATYKGSDGEEHNNAFYGRYVFNLLGGKEWQIGRDKKNLFSVDMKYTNAGGRSYTPISLEASKLSGREILQDDVYSSQYPTYYRLDIKAGFTFNAQRRQMAHSVSLDLQNVTNHQNVFTQNYDNKSRTITTTYQLGFFPNFIYRLQF